MDILARQDSSCVGNKLWYVCTVGSFRGCCSSDPCTTGICPDDKDSTSTKTTSTSSSTTSESSSIPKTSPTGTTSSSATESIGVDRSTSTTPSSTATVTSAPAPTKSGPSGAIIGGVVVGVVCLIVLALLLFFCWRRKRRGKDNTLHRSLSSQSLHAAATASPSTANASPTEREPLHPNDSSTGLPNIAQSTTGSNTNTNMSGPSSVTTSNLNVNLAGLSTISSMSTTTLASSSTRDLPRLPLMQIPSSEHLASTSSGNVKWNPQELPDTGFYRQRAELASHNQSELINIPYRERRRKDLQKYRQHKPGSRSWESSPSSSSAAASGQTSPTSSVTTPSSMGPRLMDRKTARRVVTQDGIVLNANLETSGGSPGTESITKGKESERGTDDHVMSFMTYGAGVEAGTRKKTNDTSSPGRTLMTTVSEESLSLKNEALPPYDAGDGSVFVNRDTKSPSGTLGAGVQAARTEPE